MYFSNHLSTDEDRCKETLKKLGFKKTKNTSPYSYKYKKTRAYVAKGQVIFVSWNKKILNNTEKEFLAETNCTVTTINEGDLAEFINLVAQEPKKEKVEVRKIDEIINARMVFAIASNGNELPIKLNSRTPIKEIILNKQGDRQNYDLVAIPDSSHFAERTRLVIYRKDHKVPHFVGKVGSKFYAPFGI